MRLKLLFTAGFVLFLSTLASSNECARYAHCCTGKCTAKPARPAAQTQTKATADTESSTLIINKLLYI